MEQELRFGLDLGRLALLKKKIGQLLRLVFQIFMGKKNIYKTL